MDSMPEAYKKWQDQNNPTINPFQDVIDFHEKFGLEYNGKPRALTGELGRFRREFLYEEIHEYTDSAAALETHLDKVEGNMDVLDEAFVARELELQLDAMMDEIYVAIGTSYLQFGPKVIKEAWRRVHAANMNKVRAERKEDSKRGSTFDVVKPPGWQPPSHIDLVENHAHRKANQ